MTNFFGDPEQPALPENYDSLTLSEKQAAHEVYGAQLVEWQSFCLRQGEIAREEVAAINERLRVAREKRDAAEEANKLARNEARAEELRLAQLQRLIAQEAENQRAWERANARREELDKLTENAPWRERVLPHQLDGALYLSAAQRAVCADGMGLGKTLQAVVTLDMLEALGDGGKKVLIMCPGDVIGEFDTEFRDWAPNRPVIKLGGIGGLKSAIETFNMFSTALPDVGTYIINYELVRRLSSKDLQDALILWQFDTVILDEAHKIKETDKAGFKICKKIVHAHNTCIECGNVTVSTSKKGDVIEWSEGLCVTHGFVQTTRSVKNFFAMTGTPVLNRPDEIYPLLHLKSEDIFPDKKAFFDDYCTKGWDNKMKWRSGGEQRLASKLTGSYLRRTREDAGIILPPQKIITHDIEIDPMMYPKQLELLEMLRLHAQIKIGEMETVDMASILALITRQRQATVWPGGIYMDLPDPEDPWGGGVVRTHVGANYQESAKLDFAMELINDFAEAGERWIAFSQFKEPLVELHKRLGDRAAPFYGGLSDAHKDEVKRNFKRGSGEEPKWEGVLANYAVGGVGLNLTAATQVIILDEQWSPGLNHQAYDRVNRLGQTQETAVHILHANNTIDQWLMALIEEKSKIVDGFEMELTFQQLADVFAAQS